MPVPASAFKAKEGTTPAAESESNAAASFGMSWWEGFWQCLAHYQFCQSSWPGTKFSAARERFTASFKRATTKSPVDEAQVETDAATTDATDAKAAPVTLEDNVDDEENKEATQEQ